MRSPRNEHYPIDLRYKPSGIVQYHLHLLPAQSSFGGRDTDRNEGVDGRAEWEEVETENGEDLIGVARVEICAELKVDAKEKNGAERK